MNKLVNLLSAYGFDFTRNDLMDIQEQGGLIELVKHSREETEPMLTEVVFGDDYQEVETLCESLGFDLDGMVFFN